MVLYGIGVVALIVLVGCESSSDRTQTVITNFDECVAQGNPVMESYPRQCRAGDDVFVDDIVLDGNMNDQGFGMDDRLFGKKWLWTNTEMNDDTIISPLKDGVFSISFDHEGDVDITTDCNAVGGTYIIEGQEIVFGPLRSTKMYCENSQEHEFTNMIGQVERYMFDDSGQLILLLKYDTGAMIFRGA
jgi:heat shock protein HslJ